MRLFLVFIPVVLVISSFVWSTTTIEEMGDVELTTYKNTLLSVDSTALSCALKGVAAIQDSLHEKYRFVAIVDFSKPSTEQRFYLIDLLDTSLACLDYVCHGKFSGENNTTSFSNESESNKSSLGFYKLAEAYVGLHGLSIRMDGLDQGFNNNARLRSIVMHTAAYADSTTIKELGRLGRSLGCPTLPQNTFDKFAMKLSNNAIIFHYYPDNNYLNNSVWLH